MIEIKSTTTEGLMKHPEVASTLYGPLIHHEDREKVVKKARKVYGDKFKLVFAEDFSPGRWVAVGTVKMSWEEVEKILEEHA